MAKALAALTLGLCIALSAFGATAPKKQPDWSQLTPEQQQVLTPLAGDWNNFDDLQRKKWLLTAKRYPKLKPEQQQRLQTQMRRWADLTPEQRRIARENYKKLAKQPPEKREVVKQKWQEHQKLEHAISKETPPVTPAPTAPATPAALATPAAPATPTAPAGNKAAATPAPSGLTR